jgi:hypothetical protein
MKIPHIRNTRPAQLVCNQLNIRPLVLAILSGLATLASTTPAFAGEVAGTDKEINAPLEPSPIGEKPAWLTDLSVGAKESYDNNVFLSGADSTFLPAFSVPFGSVAALKNVSSWITTISPKIGFDFVPLFGDRNVLQTLTLGYAPDFNIYHNAQSESNDVHRFTAAIKGRLEAISFNLDDAFTYIHGSKFGPVYPGDFLSAFATAADRERREQTQERANISIQYDRENWFVRPTATLLDYNLDTAQIFLEGYQNYVSRYDVNGGLDIGRKIQPQFALTVGYRYGHQYQQEFEFAPFYPAIGIAAAHSTNDYQRVLFGFEGNPWKWLSVKFQIGPDFRSFGPSTPVDNKSPVTYYGEGTLTATLTPKDTIAFRYKQWEWVSCVGLVPYFDSTFDLTYSRKMTDALTVSIGTRALGADYNPNNVSCQDAGLLGERCMRNDWEYTVSAGVQYAFNPHFSATCSYSYDLGVNEQGGLSGPSSWTYDHRSFDHQLVSLGATIKF